MIVFVGFRNYTVKLFSCFITFIFYKTKIIFTPVSNGYHPLDKLFKSETLYFYSK